MSAHVSSNPRDVVDDDSGFAASAVGLEECQEFLDAWSLQERSGNAFVSKDCRDLVAPALGERPTALFLAQEAVAFPDLALA